MAFGRIATSMRPLCDHFMNDIRHTCRQMPTGRMRDGSLHGAWDTGVGPAYGRCMNVLLPVADGAFAALVIGTPTTISCPLSGGRGSLGDARLLRRLRHPARILVRRSGLQRSNNGHIMVI
jgi:hypothetical protein